MSCTGAMHKFRTSCSFDCIDSTCSHISRIDSILEMQNTEEDVSGLNKASSWGVPIVVEEELHEGTFSV